MQNDLPERFQQALPHLCEWVDQLLHDTEKDARPVNSLECDRLGTCFSEELLSSSRVVITPELPFPPVKQLGFPELAFMEEMPAAGITFRNTFFVAPQCVTESLCFHEMIHVLQWDHLGVQRFLLAYATGLIQYGYEASPLEQMACSLQQKFDAGTTIPNLESEVITQSEQIWSDVASLFSGY